MILHLSELESFISTTRRRPFGIVDRNVPWRPPFDFLEVVGGEQIKTRAQKETIEDMLLERKINRDALIVAIGGGATLDLAGFVAATFMRGIPHVNIPTTFLAMVDAAHGGKVGLNTPLGKNLIGALHVPLAVFLEPRFLDTLPLRELNQGIAETIKHALIADRALFALIEQGASPADLLSPSLNVKCRIVREDLREENKRHLLNFGHTVGHAIERLTHFELSHGDAVAIGCRIESRISANRGFLPSQDLSRIESLLTRFSFLSAPSFSAKQLWDATQSDKKNGRMVFLKEIGSAHPFGGAYCAPFTQEDLEHALS